MHLAHRGMMAASVSVSFGTLPSMHVSAGSVAGNLPPSPLELRIQLGKEARPHSWMQLTTRSSRCKQLTSVRGDPKGNLIKDKVIMEIPYRMES